MHPKCPHTDRVYWYDVVRKYLEGKGISWTIWDYQGGFGLFEKGTNEMFDYDLDTEILTSLNFNWQQTIMNSIFGSKATRPTPDLRSGLLIQKRPLQAIIRGETVTPLIKSWLPEIFFQYILKIIP